MLIDWFTVGAQALNFIILVGLLQHFLYKPILNAVDAREKLIAGKLADAAAKEAKAQSERQAFQDKNDAFDKQRAALLAEASAAATTEGARLLDLARKAADADAAARQKAFLNDAHRLDETLRRRTQHEVFAIARKALTDLAGAGLEDRMADVFNRRLRGMAGAAKATFAAALQSKTEPVLLRSAFDLSANQRNAIKASLDETFATQVQIRFETAPDLVGGIELAANGQKIAWSIADYLASLQDNVEALLKKQEQPEAKTASKHPAKAKTTAKARTKAEPRSAKRKEPRA